MEGTHKPTSLEQHGRQEQVKSEHFGACLAGDHSLGENRENLAEAALC